MDGSFNKPQMNMTAEQMLGYIVAQVDLIPAQIRALFEYKDKSQEIIQTLKSEIDSLVKDKDYDREAIAKIKAKIELLEEDIDKIASIVEKCETLANNIEEIKSKHIAEVNTKVDELSVFVSNLISEREIDDRIKKSKIASINRFFSRWGGIVNGVISGVSIWILIEVLKAIK